MSRQRGFSLLEMLVAVALAAWLMMLAMPAFQEQMLRGRRVLATAELWELLLRQEQFFTQHRRYTDQFAELGLPEGDHYFIGADGQIQSDAGIYRVAARLLDGGQLQLEATAVGTQAQDLHCAQLWLTSMGERGSSAPQDPLRCGR